MISTGLIGSTKNLTGFLVECHRLSPFSLEQDMEEWRDVVGYEGYYQVSDTGKVKSLKRITRNNFYSNQIKHDFILKPNTDRGNYKYVALSKNAKTKSIKVHTLVLIAFVGPKPKGMCCRHIDGSRDNNNKHNLCWGTYKENQHDRRIHGTDRYFKGEEHPAAKLTEKDVLEIRKLYEDSQNTKVELAEKYNVSRENIYRIVNHLTWKHI